MSIKGSRKAFALEQKAKTYRLETKSESLEQDYKAYQVAERDWFKVSGDTKKAAFRHLDLKLKAYGKLWKGTPLQSEAIKKLKSINQYDPKGQKIVRT